MKLARNPHANQLSSNTFALELLYFPHRTNPDCLEYLTALSFPDLIDAALAVDKVYSELNFLAMVFIVRIWLVVFITATKVIHTIISFFLWANTLIS